MNRPVLFLLLSLFWVLLTWPADSPDSSYLQDMGVGLVVVALVTWMMGRPIETRARRWLEPKRYVWMIVYLFVLAAYVVKANLEVAYRVFHPAMPIRPGILKVKTRLQLPAAQTVLGNSITLTPGTLSVDVRKDGVLMVHWLNIRTLEEEEATRQLIGRFEWFVEKIFE